MIHLLLSVCLSHSHYQLNGLTLSPAYNITALCHPSIKSVFGCTFVITFPTDIHAASSCSFLESHIQQYWLICLTVIYQVQKISLLTFSKNIFCSLTQHIYIYSNSLFRKLSSPYKMVIGLQADDNRIVVEQREDREKGESIATLIISPLETKDDGLYACIARNKVNQLDFLTIFSSSCL